MGLFGSFFGSAPAPMPAPSANGAPPILQGYIPWSDRLMAAGAALGGDSATASGIRQRAYERSISQQMYARQQQVMQAMAGVVGQAQPAQYQSSPDPSISAPSVALAASPTGTAAPASLDDLGGAMAQSAAASAPGPTPAPAPAYRLPVMTKPATPGGINLLDPRTQSALAQAAMYGVPGAKEIIDIGKATMPSFDTARPGTQMYDKLRGTLGAKVSNPQYVNDQLVDPTRPDAPSFVPKYTTGTMPDGRGGVIAMPGAADAAADTAGAVAKAQELARANLDLVEVPQTDGSTVKMPRSIAVQMLAGAPRGSVTPTSAARPPAAGPPAGAPLIGGGVAPGSPTLGRSQTAAEAELAKARAATQGKNETDISGARSAMQQVDDQTNMITQNLHDMLGETQDPNTGKWVKTKPSMITNFSTGSGTDVIEHVPFINQQAKDLEGKIETVRNGTSFNSMQAIKNAMAAAGDGGSGSIRMTDQTARMLGEINGSLNQDQSGPQFEATVRRHLAQLDTLSQARHDLFASQFQGVRPTTPGQTGPTANYNKPAPASQSAPRAPQPGYVSKGYTYVGGDPHNAASWKKN
jgi:hypothetical protein